jgi:hypothetical protein
MIWFLSSYYPEFVFIFFDTSYVIRISVIDNFSKDYTICVESA